MLKSKLLLFYFKDGTTCRVVHRNQLIDSSRWMKILFSHFFLLLAETTETRVQRRESESDSDGSQAEGGGRSLDLASSHSSDEDDVTSRSHRNMGVSAQQHVTHSYLPNIHTNPAEHLNILCSNTELFPNIKPIYAPRWSSQLPEAYLSSNGENKRIRFKNKGTAAF